MKKRILSMLLALVMLATLLPLGLIDTAEAAATHSGTCGDNVTWTLDASGTLTISGKGAMADYYIFSVPWYDTRSQVKTGIIKNGVTSIGNCAFADCSSLTDVYYGGTETDWAKITIKDGNEPLLNATLHTGVVFAPANVTLVSAKAGVKYTYTVRGVASDGKTLSPGYNKTGVSAVAK